MASTAALSAAQSQFSHPPSALSAASFLNSGNQQFLVSGAAARVRMANGDAMQAKRSANKRGLPLKEQTLKAAYTALGAAGALMAAAKIAFPAQVLALDFPGTAVTAELCRAQRVLGGALLPGVAAAFALRDAASNEELRTGDALRLNIGLIAFGIGVANSVSRIPAGVILEDKAHALSLVSSAVSIIVGCIGAVQ
eukprot:TRINITY_DN12377_c0_g1_i2.p1 TRINITY_DN12377_c0_g1~~TRINITY_DN12377_c0_g1_i2.p1  ORF type:complete len:196 (+),score=31.41 TRINITY_DN12377_c0_g1_i2:127-714(+)